MDWKKNIFDSVDIHLIGSDAIDIATIVEIKKHIFGIDLKTITGCAFDNDSAPSHKTAALIALECLIDDLSECQVHDILHKSLIQSDVPTADWIWQEDEFSKTKAEFQWQTAFKSNTLFQLRLIRQISKSRYNSFSMKDQSKILETLSYYHNPDCPWSNIMMSAIASSRPEYNNEIIRHIIESSLQPLLVDLKSVNSVSKITRAGYKKQNNSSMSGLRPQLGMSSIVDESRAKWKKNSIKSIPLLLSIITEIDPKELQSNWHIFISSILNILDDHEGMIKIQGCQLLVAFLNKVSYNDLARTGIAPIFADAIKPCLSYLPSSSVSSASSIKILNESYSALIKLIRKSSKDREEKATQLSDILVSNILASIVVVRDNFEVLSVLLLFTNEIVAQSGVYATRNISTLLYYLCNIICDPFVVSCLPLLKDCLQTLSTIMTNCWQRIDNHKYDLLGALFIAYRRTLDEDIRDSLLTEYFIDNLKILRNIVSEKEEFEDDLYQIVLEDERLRSLTSLM